MKKILSLLSFLLIFACSTQKRATENREEKRNSNAEVSTLKVEKSSIIKNMEYLASDALEGRATGSVGIEKAAVFIENFLKVNNIEPYFETYRDNFQIEVKQDSGEEHQNLTTIEGFNVVGVVEGNDPKLKQEYIILGGHYDHIGKGQEVNGDIIANGANDDASGTIAAMELAAYFAKTKSNKRSILVTLYSAEEMGLKGSAHLAERLKEAGLNAYTMINFEMIGVPRAADKPMAYMSGYERSNFAETLNEYAGKEIIGFFPKAKQFQLFKRSDNYPFYKAFHIPAHAISTFDFTNFEYYHHVDDEADKMDYEHMTRFINAMIPALEGMMNAPTKEVVLKDE